MQKALADLVRRRSAGRCEYCHITAPPFQIEHIVARQHGGETVAENLAIACIWCNAYKGPNIAGIDPQTGAVVQLFHPRNELWTTHFRWEGVHLIGITPTGRATVAVLNINDPVRIKVRQKLIEKGRMSLT